MRGASTGAYELGPPDTTPPVIDSHDDVTAEATGSAGAVVSYTTPATSDAVDGPRAATCAPVSGSTFALGDTTVTCNATDAAGNDATPTTFVVHVVDTMAPTIAAQADVGPVEATSAAGAVVSYTPPATADAVDDPGAAICAPVPGGTFALGDTTVTCNATDAAGNDATPTTFVVHVVDTTAPTIAAQADVGPVEATSAAGAVVSYTPPGTADAVDDPGAATCAPVPGSTFALGDTTVTCNAADAAGNEATPTTFVVRVVDTTAPTIAAHADVGPVEATSAAGAVVSYTTPATADAVDGPGTATCAPVPGSTFALGDTTVTCTATDSHGNAATPTHFLVLVRYRWSGFFQPVDNKDASGNLVLNIAKAGSAIPVKFSLGGNMGLSILNAGYPKVVNVPCPATAPEDEVEGTAAAGGSSLSYDSVTGQYTYVWKTYKAWEGTCWVFHLGLNDGSTHDAYFHFTK